MKDKQLLPLPPKPDGTVRIGREIKVLVNCFAFKNFPPSNAKIYHYDITIKRSGSGQDEARPSKSKQGDVRGFPERISRNVVKWMEEHNLFAPRAGYDGNKSLYAPQELTAHGTNQPIESHTWTDLAIPDDPESGAGSDARLSHYDVEIKRVNLDRKDADHSISLEELRRFCNGETPETNQVQHCINALNTIFNHQQWNNYPNKGRSFFDHRIQKEASDRFIENSSRGRGGPRGGRGGPRGGGHFGGPGGGGGATLGFSATKGVEIWRGYYTSIRPVSGGVVLNVDVTHMPFITASSLQRVMASILNVPERDLVHSLRDHRSYRNLKQILTNCRISYYTKDIKQQRVIKEVGRQPAHDQSFDHNGSRLTIESYYQQAYNIRLRHPDLPCVRVSRNAWIPVELCTVELGNKYKATLTPDQISASIRFTTMKPAERMSFIRRVDCINPGQNPLLTDARMNIDAQPMVVPGQIIPKPTLLFNNTRRERISVAPDNQKTEWLPKWFVTPAKLTHWIIAVFATPQQCPKNMIQDCVATLLQAFRENGVEVRHPEPEIYYSERHHSNGNYDVKNSFKQWGSDYRQKTGQLPEFMLCFIGQPGTTTPAHMEIKQFGDNEFGVPTQCVSVSKLTGPKGNAKSRQYWANVVLKINPKLRNPENHTQAGLNHYLSPNDWAQLNREPTIICGADCAHAAPGSREPTFASVVGTIDLNFVQYTSAYRVQSSRTEVILEMSDMMEDILTEFMKIHKRMPERLLMYRDGVSEGQYQIILLEEVPQIRLAFERVQEKLKQISPNAPIKPLTITYVICAKRHHIRFKPVEDREGDRNGNAPPGTYVDEAITVPHAWSFYLLSHAGLLGTSRPTLYTVILNECGIDADRMAKLTHNLCYTYARSNRAVSIATPAYYAHHACTRAKELCTPPTEDDSASTISSQSDESAIREALLNSYTQHARMPHSGVINTLYFM